MCKEEAKAYYGSINGFEEMEDCNIDEEESWHDIEVGSEVENEDTGNVKKY